MRPILLTAAAAMLGMLPIAFDVFWGPMAYAMIGGIAVATLLTLIFLPALYIVTVRRAQGGSNGNMANASTPGEVAGAQI
jgi:multidrug efflux pump subunit AcrB